MTKESGRNTELERYAFDVFLSHNSKDKPAIREIALALTALGLRCWLDEEQLRPGMPWVELLEGGLETSRATAVFVGPHGLGPWEEPEMQAALRLAVSRKMPVIPVRLPGAPEEVQLPLFLGGNTWVDLREGVTHEGLARLFWGITGERPSLPPAPPALPPVWNIRFRRDPHFTGREAELSRIREALKPGARAVLSQAAAVRGLGGVGKTALAVEYAYRYSSDYRAIWWIRAERIETLRGDLRALAEELGLPEAKRPELEPAVRAAYRWLRENRGWLLIFDNVEDARLIEEHLPEGEGAILITSRAQSWGGIAQEIDVRSLPIEEAVAFLLESLPGETDRAAAESLATELGGLPLALAQAAAYCRACAIGPDRYLGKYRERPAAMLANQKHPAERYELTVEASLGLSLDAVVEEEPAALALLELASFLAPEAIPFDLFTGEELPELLKDADLEELRAPLIRFSLIDVKEDSFSVHRLVQLLLRERMDEHRRRAVLSTACALLNAALPTADDPINWPIYKKLIDHSRSTIELVEEGTATKELARLCNQTGFYLHHVASEYRTANFYYLQALHTYESTLGRDHIILTLVLNNLGLLLKMQGHFDEAMQHYLRALGIIEQENEQTHPAGVWSLNNMGALLDEMGHLDEALDYYQRASHILEASSNPIQPVAATLLNNIGLIYESRMELSKAQSHFTRALQICEESLGSTHPKTAAILNNMGSVYRKSGDLEAAEMHLLRALNIREKFLGAMHRDTAISLNNIGSVCHERGKTKEARLHMQRALATFMKLHGPDHQLTRGVMQNIRNLGPPNENEGS